MLTRNKLENYAAGVAGSAPLFSPILLMKPFLEKKWEILRSALKRFRRKITYSSAFTGLFAFLAAGIIALYNKTLRIQFYFHPEFLKLDRTKVCYGFWHGRQFLLIPNFTDWNVSIMTDVSWAGEVQSKILKRFTFSPVRGSSKRNGMQALLNMKRSMEQGCSGAFALDGPRGPLHKSKPGILFLAQKMGYPIVPMTTSADRAWILKNTWCHYLLPKPFSRCYIALGKPIWEAAGDGQLESAELDRILDEETAEADRKTGRAPEEASGTSARSVKS
jgi:lysophospholipid acyltransferase (LPLAT)-like uncharacterized protein